MFWRKLLRSNILAAVLPLLSLAFAGWQAAPVSGAALSTRPPASPAGPASAASGAVFLKKTPDAILNDQTASISVAADSTGGMHAAFGAFSSDAQGNWPVYYDQCPASQDCSNPANWALVVVTATTGTMNAVQLALDPQGQPRLVVVTTDSNGSHYDYAACDSGCSTAANWKVVRAQDADVVDVFSYTEAKHFFALDPQGRPRFIIYGGQGFLGANALVYVYCDSGCATKSHWPYLPVAAGQGKSFTLPDLAFDPAGKPRLLAYANYSSDFSDHLEYYECSAADCSTNAASWSSTALINGRGTEAVPTSSLRIDPQGRPRFAFYGPLDNKPAALYYLWCNSACTSQQSWGRSSAGLALAGASPGYFEGQDPDLALDSQGRPRLSFRTLDKALGVGLGYAWCDTGCETASPTWKNVLVEPVDQLAVEWPRLPPANCAGGLWTGAYRTALTLDSSGNPRIGYDSQFVPYNCSGPASDYRTVRFVFFPAPAGQPVPQPPKTKLFLPVVEKQP